MQNLSEVENSLETSMIRKPIGHLIATASFLRQWQSFLDLPKMIMKLWWLVRDDDEDSSTCSRWQRASMICSRWQWNFYNFWDNDETFTRYTIWPRSFHDVSEFKSSTCCRDVAEVSASWLCGEVRPLEFSVFPFFWSSFSFYSPISSLHFSVFGIKTSFFGQM